MGAARFARPEGHQVRLRQEFLRGLHGASRWNADALLRDAHILRGLLIDYHHRGGCRYAYGPRAAALEMEPPPNVPSVVAVAGEAAAYGYENEDRHFVRVFLGKEAPRLDFDDGLEVVSLLMAAYMSAEQGKTLEFPPPGLDTFVPAVARGAWRPR